MKRKIVIFLLITSLFICTFAFIAPDTSAANEGEFVPQTSSTWTQTSSTWTDIPNPPLPETGPKEIFQLFLTTIFVGFIVHKFLVYNRSKQR